MKHCFTKKRSLLLAVVLLASSVTAETEMADETHSLEEGSLHLEETTVQADWQRILNAEHREAGNRARDQYRHPALTLAFFKVSPSMHVVEIWPGKGWYTEVLAPYLKDKGKLTVAGFSKTAEKSSEWRKNVQQQFEAKLAAHPEVYAAVEVTALSVPEDVVIAEPASADRVLTFRNVHNWMKGEYAPDVFDAMYKALKPGGILGVVEHRARPGTSLQDMIVSGYVTEQHVKKLAADAGFEFIASSEVNANVKDTRDHPKGVWTLPPTLRLKDQNREQYLEIGESDRMTLMFRKPGTGKP